MFKEPQLVFKNLRNPVAYEPPRLQASAQEATTPLESSRPTALSRKRILENPSQLISKAKIKKTSCLAEIAHLSGPTKQFNSYFFNLPKDFEEVVSIHSDISLIEDFDPKEENVEATHPLFIGDDFWIKADGALFNDAEIACQLPHPVEHPTNPTTIATKTLPGVVVCKDSHKTKYAAFRDYGHSEKFINAALQSNLISNFAYNNTRSLKRLGLNEPDLLEQIILCVVSNPTTRHKLIPEQSKKPSALVRNLTRTGYKFSSDELSNTLKNFEYEGLEALGLYQIKYSTSGFTKNEFTELFCKYQKTHFLMVALQIGNLFKSIAYKNPPTPQAITQAFLKLSPNELDMHLGSDKILATMDDKQPNTEYAVELAFRLQSLINQFHPL